MFYRVEQVLTIFLQKDEKVEQIRKKYVPNYEKLKLHITLVYPFEFKDQDKLKKYILKSLKGFDPFEISLKGLQKSAKGYYLYLFVNVGKEIVVRMIL